MVNTVKYVEPSFKIIAVTWPLNAEDDFGDCVTSANKIIELAGRTCYKSEDKIIEGSANEFVKMISKRGHLSVIEHVNVTVKFISNRGFTHELVRHRLCSYSQESTRYCDYQKGKFGSEITVIDQRMIILEEMVKSIYDPIYGNEDKSIGEQIDGFKKWLVEYGVRKVTDNGWINALTGEPDSMLNNAFAAIGDWIDAMCKAESAYLRMREHDVPPQVARGVLPIDLKTEIVTTANLRQWGHIFRLRTSPTAHPNMHQLMIPLLEEFKKMFPGIYDKLEVF